MKVAEHRPSDPPTVREIKDLFNELATKIDQNVLPGRRKALALTNLEQASMWAIKAAWSGDN